MMRGRTFALSRYALMFTMGLDNLPILGRQISQPIDIARQLRTGSAALEPGPIGEAHAAA